MNVRIKGKTTDATVCAEDIRAAAIFYIETLLPDNEDISSSITLDVCLVSGLRAKYGSVGYCFPTDDSNRPLEFEIELEADQGYKAMLISLAHEIVHLYQLVMGYKSTSLDGKTHRWMGITIDCDRYHYYDLPWEIDAHGREFGLYDRFIASGNVIQSSSDNDNDVDQLEESQSIV